MSSMDEAGTSVPFAELRLHPRAELVPRMDGRGFAEFQADIARRGILVPLEITASKIVLDGKERLRAAEALGISQVPVRVVAPDDEVEYILLCALERRQLSASQRAAVAVELAGYRQLRADAETRRLANLRQSTEVADLPPRGKTREVAAGWAGVSARTVQDAQTVKDHDPDLFEQVKAGELAADAAARRVRRCLRDAALPPPPPLPDGPFQLVYADPPWQLGHADSEHAPERHYPCMPLDEIKHLHVPAADDAILFLWAVNCLLAEALETMQAWGFSYKTNLAWVKPSVGLGFWARNRHELLLVGCRGRLSPPDTDQRPDSVTEAPRGRHSEKPVEFYELIETAYPHLTKLELFARTARPGWTAWGNQLAA
jgi:N6-adenosine-specific RNA methylase IME4